jgi:hypothetical protein
MKLPSAVLDDLARSGLTVNDARKLEIEHVPATKKGFGGATEADAYRIPYFELNGKVNGFYRDRFIGDALPKDKRGKPQRYKQSAGTAPHFYFSPLGGCDWQKIAADTSVALYITEGEKKSAALCKLGVPCIGLGGVWNWRTDSRPIDDFSLINWQGRNVHIVFDSDVRFKSDVQCARDALAKELIRRGAAPFFVDLPTLPGNSKTGLDDFIVHHGGSAKARKAVAALPAYSLLIPAGYTFQEIAEKKLPDPKWSVLGLIPVGLTELVGKPKIGKSWLALDVSTSVARGSKVLGNFATTQGTTLYLALEDTPRRFQDRLKRVLDGACAPSNAHFYPTWLRVEENGLDALRRSLDQQRDTRLVVIDTLARMRARPSGNGNLYHEDYDAVATLKQIADDYSVAVVVVHHLRKATSDDPLDLISGSTGITGAADTILILRRERGHMDASLYVTGRDVTEQELALELDQRTMRWRALGAATDYRMNNERRKIIDALRAFGRSATPTEVANATDKKRGAVQRLMLKMTNEGELRWLEGGKYELREGGKNEK